VIVGGTGLYIRALTRGLANLPSADEALRATFAQHSLAQLQAMLREMDPSSAASVDMQNRRRVARALEVRMLTGRSFTAFRNEWDAPVPQDVRGVIVMRPRAELFTRIDERTRHMFASGVIDEVRRAGEIGPTAAQAIGYRQIRALLAGQCTEEECTREIQQATRRYAKRQITWLRKETHFARVDVTAGGQFGDAIERCVTAITAS
jgi:tRNA dimethylallyltransferase